MGELKISAGKIEILRTLLDRLGSPDLTLGESKALRAQLLALLERGGPVPLSTSSGTGCPDRKQVHPSPCCGHCAA